MLRAQDWPLELGHPCTRGAALSRQGARRSGGVARARDRELHVRRAHDDDAHALLRTSSARREEPTDADGTAAAVGHELVRVTGHDAESGVGWHHWHLETGTIGGDALGGPREPALSPKKGAGRLWNSAGFVAAFVRAAETAARKADDARQGVHVDIHPRVRIVRAAADALTQLSVGVQRDESCFKRHVARGPHS